MDRDSYGTAAEVSKREAQIPAELDRLEKAIEYLFQSAGRLNERLSPVMSPPPPEANAEKSPQEFRVPVADAIWTAAVKVDVMARRLEDMTRRLQV